MRLKRKYLLLLGLGLFFLVQAGGICWSQSTERVSVDSAGTEATGGASNAPSTSSDGRYVAFESDATDLVGTDTNGWTDIFVRDRQTPTTTRVSIHSDGITQGNNRSKSPSISADGMHVAFESWATNLVASGGDMFPDIYVHDRQTGFTNRVSVDSGGNEQPFESFAPSISGDGRYVAFQSAADLVLPDNGLIDIYVHDRDADGNGTYDEAGFIATVRVSVDSTGVQGQGNDHSYFPSISGDGRYVAFESIATDLVSTDTNVKSDIFVRDLLAGTTTLVSVDSADNQGNDHSYIPSISADGRYVAFQSGATNLVPSGSNGSLHIFVHDRDTDGDGIYDEAGAISTTQVSVDSAGTEGDAGSRTPSISADGRYVAFESDATNLVAGDTNGFSDIFVHDLLLGTTRRVGLSSTGGEAISGGSSSPSYSADGQYVAFESLATDLVAGDTNGVSDVFIRETMPPTITSTGPADSTTDVAVDADITATFSEEMKASTIHTTTFTLDNGATGMVSYDAISTTATFTPTGNLNYDTTYTATITTGVEDLAGNNLQADYSWSFTTGPAPDTIPPAVNDTNPVDSATDLAVDAGITATFSEAMQASTVNATTFTLDNGATGMVSYDAISTTATFTPTSNLNYDTIYTATITTDAEDMAGNGLQANHSWSFTTQSEGNSGGDGRCFIGTAADGFGW